MKAIFNFRNLLATMAVSALALVFTACDKDDPTPAAPPNIVQLAQSDTGLSLLVAAVVKANLVDFLGVTNDLTVFAPTNNAFRAAGITAEVINAYTTDQVTNVLTPILTYHVLRTRVPSTGVPASDAVATQNGKNVYASKNTNGVFINGKKVSTPDLSAANGIVHKIDGVLIPPTQTIAQIVSANINFSTLLSAVTLAGLADELSGPGKFTVFAPDNAAFNRAGVTSLAGLTAADALGIVGQHTFTTNIFASDLTNGETPATLNSTKKLMVTLAPSSVTVKVSGSTNPASVVTAVDIVATNGVIHLIDRTLL